MNSAIKSGSVPVRRVVSESGKRGPVCTLCGDPRDSGPVWIEFGAHHVPIGLTCADAIAAARTPEA